MTAKEKAKELAEKYYAFIDFSEVYQPSSKSAKQCALICVNEIQDTFKSGENEILYWEEVKQEINKL
jgi:hypothetical protein